MYLFIQRDCYKIRTILRIRKYKNFSITKVSEIADFPIGMILYIDPNDNTKIEGTDITEFSSFNYDEKQNILLPLYCKDVNTPFPCDFRTKSEIMK